MKILVLKSCGNTNGSSNILADEFIRGAMEAGHEITEYDVIRKDIRSCRGCNACGMAGACGTPSMTRNTKYPEQAYRLGKSL